VREQGGGKVLVHCKMGRSRSATLVLMWMVFHHGMSLAEAWRKLKHCRRQIGLNSGFTRTLINFERQHTGVTTVSWSTAKGLRLNV
jgi:atypical dual specificity phosphatase